MDFNYVELPPSPGHQLPGAAALSPRGDHGLGPLPQRRLLRPRRAASDAADGADPGEAERPLQGADGGGGRHGGTTMGFIGWMV